MKTKERKKLVRFVAGSSLILSFVVTSLRAEMNQNEGTGSDSSCCPGPCCPLHDDGEQPAPRDQTVVDLAKKNGCMNCHTVDQKLVGPALKDVAAKYKDDPSAQGRLEKIVKRGSHGTWGPVSTTQKEKISEADAKALVQWILSIK